MFSRTKCKRCTKIEEIFIKTDKQILKEKGGFVTGFVTGLWYTDIVDRNWEVVFAAACGSAEAVRGP